MTTFGVVTDVHYGPEARFQGKLRKLTHQADALMSAFAARMQRDTPDRVVCLGDCIEDRDHDADLAAYRQCMSRLNEAGPERICVAGNHDRINLDGGELRAAWGLGPGPLYRSFAVGPLHVVVLATHEERDTRITIDRDQLAWLEADLAASSGDVVVFMHHSAADQDLRGNRWFEGAPHICLVEGRQALRALFEGCGRVRLVMNGHLHWNHCQVIAGIPYVTLQSLIENIDDDAPGRPAAAHAWITHDASGVHVDVRGEQPCRYQFATAR